MVFLAILGISWEPLGHLGTSGLILPGLWFACLPAAYAWGWGLSQMHRAPRLLRDRGLPSFT